LRRKTSTIWHEAEKPVRVDLLRFRRQIASAPDRRVAPLPNAGGWAESRIGGH
jgi:hypothetical protein